MLSGDVSADHLRALLQVRQAEIAQRVKEDQAQLARVAARLRQIEQEDELPPYEVARKVVPAQLVATIRQMTPEHKDLTAYRRSIYDELYAWLVHQQITPTGPELALYHHTEYREQDIDMELGVVIPASIAGSGAGRVTIAPLPAAAQMASVTHHGDVWDFPQAFTALFTWMQANHSGVTGPYRKLHLYGRENDLQRWDNLALELQLPVMVTPDEKQVPIP